jgi:hypothetical protein
MSSMEQPPGIVRWTRQLEETTALDTAVHALEPTVRSLFGSGPRGAALRGEWLGHAVHPILTDLVIGTWTSATLLDVVGGRASAKASQRLIGVGLLAVGPTAWTGWAEWSEAGPREKRVGVVHAVTNAVAIGTYAASWSARRKGRRGRGAVLAMAGAGVASAGAYLGGHLAIARKVGTHDPAYDDQTSVDSAGTAGVAPGL